MRRLPARCHDAQLSLFHPPQPRPAWRTLPKEVRQSATRLLARLLRQHQAACVPVGREVGDE